MAQRQAQPGEYNAKLSHARPNEEAVVPLWCLCRVMDNTMKSYM